MTKPRHGRLRRTGPNYLFATLLLVSGLGLAVWSLAVLRPEVPMQDPAVQPSTSASGVTASPLEGPSPDVGEAAAPGPAADRSGAAAAEPLVSPPTASYPTPPILDEKIGTITLPSLSLSWPIFEGTQEKQLSQGVGHFVGSALPGIQDNSVLSGHRATVFGRLGELSEGDLIFVSTSAGVFTYEVRSFRIVERTDRTVIVPRPTATLTLTTCYPFYQIGRTTDAFIVTAELVSSQLSGNR